MLVFFVSGEKRITKQIFLVLYGYLFPEKVSVFENLRKALGPSSLHGYPRHAAYRYNHKSYVIRLKTDNWQYAAQSIAENQQISCFKHTIKQKYCPPKNVLCPFPQILKPCYGPEPISPTKRCTNITNNEYRCRKKWDRKLISKSNKNISSLKHVAEPANRTNNNKSLRSTVVKVILSPFYLFILFYLAVILYRFICSPLSNVPFQRNQCYHHVIQSHAFSGFQCSPARVAICPDESLLSVGWNVGVVFTFTTVERRLLLYLHLVSGNIKVSCSGNTKEYSE